MNPLWDALFARHEGSRKPFLRDGTTYGDLISLAARYAHLLTEHGLKPRDRLAVQVEKSPELLALYAACIQTGIVFVPLDPASTTVETEFFVSDCAAAMLVADPAADKLRDIARRYGARFLTLAADGSGTLRDLSAGPTTFPTNPRAAVDLAALSYTAGSSARPRGAMLTQGNLLSNAQALADRWRVGEADVVLHPLPMFDHYGLLAAVNTVVAAGGSMILVPSDTDAVIEDLPHATIVLGVPDLYAKLLAEDRFDGAQASGIRLFVSGATALRDTVRSRMEARTGQRIAQLYAMAETGVIAADSCDEAGVHRSIGPALAGVSLRSTVLGEGPESGESGILQVKGPSVFQGYWGKPRKTREALSPDGWFRTDDLVRIGEADRLEVLGHCGDAVLAAGRICGSREVERPLEQLPGVREACVICTADADLGVTVIATLVPAGNGPDLASVYAALTSMLAGVGIPHRTEVIAALPKSSMGKVRRLELLRRRADRSE